MRQDYRVLAYVIAALVVVQVALGLLARTAPVLGAVHGGLALVLFGLAVTGAMRSRPVGPTADARVPV